jgi:vitamin B12 transporter
MPVCVTLGFVRRCLTAAVVLAGFALAAAEPVSARQPIPLDTLRATAGSRAVLGAASLTRSVDIIDRRALEALPARSLGDVLARALGVDLLGRSPAQADLAIRGSGFEQVLVMVDGVPVNDDQTGHFHLNLAVPLDAVERIEVLRGPASALYGSAAVGGVVNIVTRRGENAVDARAQAGSFGAMAAGVGVAASRPGWSAHLSADHDRADGHRPGTDHAVSQTRLTVDAPLAKGTTRLDVGFAARDFGASAFYAPADSYEETRALTAAASWRSRPASFSVHPRVAFRRHEDDFVLRRGDPAFYRNLHTSRQLSSELVARWTAADRLHAAAGAEASWSDLESSNLGDRDEQRVAVFAELVAGHAGAGLLTAGVRFDEHSTFGSFLSPSIAAGYRISPAVRVRASANSGFRAPNWTERFYRDPSNIGNPDLDAEKFWTAEIGAELRHRNAGSLDLVAFVRRSDDLIDWARPAGASPAAPWRTTNIQQATFRGIEATARSAVAAVQLAGRAAVLGFTAEDAAGMTSKYALRPLTQSLSLEATAPLLTGLNLSARAAHQRRSGGEEWQLLDGRMAYVRGGSQIFLDATNIGNAVWPDVTGEPAPGRAFSVGVRLRR